MQLLVSGSYNIDADTAVGNPNISAPVSPAGVATVTGDPFATIVTRWALAIYATDRPGIPAELQYDSWNLHTVYFSLNAQRPDAFQKPYPLSPLMFPAQTIGLLGSLHAGSGLFFDATQSANDPGFTISFTAPTGAPISAAMGPRLTVLRLQ